jgi:purine-binding chemotaxis protein CheW
MSHQELTFFVHGEEFAVEILRVREVMGVPSITRVPTTPPSIRGVVNIRGTVVPIVDLGLRFGLPELPLTKRTCIVIVEVQDDGAETGMGLLVDRVNEVVDLEDSQIEEVPAFGVSVRLDFLRGVAAVSEKLVMLLDVDRVLSTADLRAAAAAAAEPAASEDTREGAGA